VKVFASNFKVEKSENLDNAFYAFLRFFDVTLQKRKKLILELCWHYIDFIVYLVNLMRFVIILIKLLCM